MRTGVRASEVFDALVAAYQVRLYPTEAERTQALADLAATSALNGETGVLVMADTRDQVAALNGAIRDKLVAAGYVDDRLGLVTGAGERLGVGDRVMTRRNDRDLAVANRDTWTITGISNDDTLTVHGDGRHSSRTLPAAYVHEHVELAYATTVHGAQGETTHTGHLLLGERTSAAAAYVAMTRGREANVAHLVAENLDEARHLWVETFGRDRAELGPAHAARRAAEDLHRYAPHRPLGAALTDLRAAWSAEQDLRAALARAESRHQFMASDFMAGDGDTAALHLAESQAAVDQLRDRLATATDQVRARLHEPAIRTLPPGRIDQEHADWLQHRHHAQQAAQAGWETFNHPRTSRDRPPYGGYPSTPERGRGISR
jgi:hypothetical protein